MRLDDWKRAGRMFDFEGHRIFYRDEGAGDALVCIHGYPTASWDWHRLWPDLTRRFRVIAPDLLGFGFSDKPSRHRYSVLEYATLYEKLLASLGVARAHVLAHDLGDTVAQELLARHEERRGAGAPGLALRSVCFLNGGLFPETHRPRTIQRLLAGPLGPILSRLVNERAFGRSFTAVFGPGTQPPPEELRDFWTLISYNRGTRVSHRLIRYMAERRQHRERWVGVLQRTRVPIRLVDGAVDPVSGAHMAARFRELVPGADVVLLENIGHYPQIEDPRGVLEAFLAFIDKLPPEGDGAGAR